MNEITANYCSNDYTSFYVLTDNKGDKYNLELIFKNHVYKHEIENFISTFPNSEIEWIISKLKNIIEKSNRTMTFILQKVNVLDAHQFIDDFLKLEDSEKELFLEKFRKKLEIAIHSADMNRIVEKTSGEALFHQLLRSKSAQVRLLALECISAGFPIDSTNKKGNTGLLLAVVIKDSYLTRQLLERGANPDYQCERFTPKELARAYKLHLVTLEFFSHDLKKLNNNIDDIVTLWKNISDFKSGHSDGYYERDENTNEILKICEKQINTLIKSLISSVDSDFDFKSIFSRKNSSLREDFLRFCCYEGFEAILFKNFIIFDLLDRLSEYLVEGISRDFSEERDLKLLKFLIDSRLFFALTKKNTRASYIDILRVNPKVNSLINILETFDEKKLSSCVFLSKLIHSSFLNFLEEHKNIQLTISQFEENDFALANIFNKIFKTEFFELDKHVEALTHYHGNSLEFFDLITKKNLDLPYFNDCCVYFEQWKLCSETYDNKLFGGSVEKFQARMFFHLFLDKFMIPPKQSLEKSSLSCTSGGLISAFNTMESNISDNNSLTNMLNLVKSEIMPLLKNLNELCTFEKQWIRLQQMENGEKLFFPVVSQEHIMSLLVERTSEKNFRLTLYNTGLGVIRWHPRWLDSSRYQTYLVVDQVPASSILEKGPWQRLLLKDTGNINSLYSIIFDEMGAKGVKLPPSSYEEEYDAIQLSMTCAMQTLLAMIRHQTMQIVSGSFVEKEAKYKYLKIALQESWLKSQIPEHLNEVSKWVPHVSHKLNVEKKLFDLAMDIDASNKALNECRMLLCQEGHNKAAETLKDVENIGYFERYTLQRKTERLLCSLWKTKAIEISGLFSDENNPIIDLALIKLSARTQLEANFLENLDQAEESNDMSLWINAFITFIVYNNSFEYGIKEFIKRIKDPTTLIKIITSEGSNPQKDAMDALVLQLKKYPTYYTTPLIEYFYQQLKLACLDQLAETLK